ncbi:MAG: DUF192 domain-containing protein [Spirochaetaceae bacterium]
MNFKYIILITIFAIFSCSSDFLILEINSSKLKIEIANTDELRSKGLMNRENLESDHGMLFIFDKEQPVGFWMKNTSIPLSIAYINKKGVIMEIYDMKPYSLETVPSKRSSVLYALEVNKGYFELNNINIGDKIGINKINIYLNSSK